MTITQEPMAKKRQRSIAESLPRHVRDLLVMVNSNDHGLSALEVGLMDTALLQLHMSRDEVINHVKSRQKVNKRLMKAMVKTAIQTGDHTRINQIIAKIQPPKPPPDRSGQQWVVTVGSPGYNIPGYWRSAPKGWVTDQDTMDEIDREQSEYRKKATEYERKLEDEGFNLFSRPRGQEPQSTDPRDAVAPFKVLDDRKQGVDVVATAYDVYDGLASSEPNEYQEALSTFLDEKKGTRGIAAVADFLTRSNNKVNFAIRAITEFGPVTGSRVALAYMRYGGYDVPLVQDGDGRVFTEFNDKLPVPTSRADTENWAKRTLSNRLPNRDAYDSKAKPPSEGFIIDRHGNILAHGVGRGDDHFLPFNTRHLRSMKNTEGVSFVRRRMVGGPTIEDFHAAMMMGADRFTIVSNGGTFEVNLSHRSHGFKMEHYQVLERYAQLLEENKSWNFQAYNDALSAINAEFPLHFPSFDASPGSWRNDDDIVRPRERFRDQLRRAMNILSGNESPGSQRHIERIKRSNEDVRREVRRRGSAQHAFDSALQRNPDVGMVAPAFLEWIKEEREQTRQPNAHMATERYITNKLKLFNQRMRDTRSTPAPSAGGPVTFSASETELEAARARSALPQASGVMPRAETDRALQRMKQIEAINIGQVRGELSSNQALKSIVMNIGKLDEAQWNATADQEFLHNLENQIISALASV